jgi:glycosyltransferase involved in cell wall biosynthesis
MGENAKVRVRQFTWKRYAQETAKVYEKLMG